MERGKIAELVEWSCGHILSTEDEEFLDYSEQVEDRKQLPFVGRRCPKCRLGPFFRRIADLEEMALQFMEDGEKRSDALREYMDKLVAQHKQTVRQFIAEGLDPSPTLSATLWEADSGDRLCHNWMAMESVMMVGFRAEIDDCELALGGLHRRLTFLVDIVEIMGGMLAKPRQWLDEREPIAQVENMYASFVRWAEDIRGWVAKHVEQKKIEYQAIRANLFVLKKLWKAQQDQTCRLLREAKCSGSKHQYVPTDGPQ